MNYSSFARHETDFASPITFRFHGIHPGRSVFDALIPFRLDQGALENSLERPSRYLCRVITLQVTMVWSKLYRPGLALNPKGKIFNPAIHLFKDLFVLSFRVYVVRFPWSVLQTTNTFVLFRKIGRVSR